MYRVFFPVCFLFTDPYWGTASGPFWGHCLNPFTTTTITTKKKKMKSWFEFCREGSWDLHSMHRVKVRNSVRFWSWDPREHSLPSSHPLPLSYPLDFFNLFLSFSQRGHQGPNLEAKGFMINRGQSQDWNLVSLEFSGCFLQPGLWTLGCQAAWAFACSTSLLLMVSLCMAQARQMQLLVTSCPGLNLFYSNYPHFSSQALLGNWVDQAGIRSGPMIYTACLKLNLCQLSPSIMLLLQEPTMWLSEGQHKGQCQIHSEEDHGSCAARYSRG